jgi:hypothetical protein
VRVVFEPFGSAGDEQCHAALDVERPVVERNAQAADVRVARREEPLAQVRQVVVGAHDVESVFGKVVVHCFVVELLADYEQLGFGVGR